MKNFETPRKTGRGGRCPIANKENVKFRLIIFLKILLKITGRLSPWVCHMFSVVG